MISAKEARQKTLLNTKLKTVMKLIEEQINRTIEIGWYSTSVGFSQDLDQYLLETLTKELESLGYVVKYEPSKSCPYGCRADQWDFNSYLKIGWESEEYNDKRNE